MRRPLEHRQQGILVAEGEKVVRRLLESPLEVLSLLVTSDWLAELEASEHQRGTEAVPVFLAGPDLMSEIVGFNIHQGIMAVARVPVDISLTDIPSGHLLLALDGLRISENVGVIVRNAAALGACAHLVGEASASPYLRRAVRSSMGAIFSTPVLHVPCLVEALLELRRRFGTRIVAADPHAGAPIYDLDLSGNVCLVLGNEDYGISPATAAVVSVSAAIPMHNRTDSLNVASAAAVFLYEAARQRAHGGCGT